MSDPPGGPGRDWISAKGEYSFKEGGTPEMRRLVQLLRRLLQDAKDNGRPVTANDLMERLGWGNRRARISEELDGSRCPKRELVDEILLLCLDRTPEADRRRIKIISLYEQASRQPRPTAKPELTGHVVPAARPQDYEQEARRLLAGFEQLFSRWESEVSGVRGATRRLHAELERHTEVNELRQAHAEDEAKITALVSRLIDAQRQHDTDQRLVALAYQELKAAWHNMAEARELLRLAGHLAHPRGQAPTFQSEPGDTDLRIDGHQDFAAKLAAFAHDRGALEADMDRLREELYARIPSQPGPKANRPRSTAPRRALLVALAVTLVVALTVVGWNVWKPRPSNLGAAIGPVGAVPDVFSLPFLLDHVQDDTWATVARNAPEAGVAIQALPAADVPRNGGVWELVRRTGDESGTAGEIRPAGTLFMCLALRGSNKGTAGTLVEQAACDGHPSQQWSISSAGPSAEFRLVNLDSGHCLATGGPDSALRQVLCNEGDESQRWQAHVALGYTVVDVSKLSRSLEGPAPLRQEFAQGGSDKPCVPGQEGQHGELPGGVTWRPRTYAADWTEAWKPEESSANFGPAKFGPNGTAASASLVQVNIPDRESAQEFYYYAQAFARASTAHLHLALQWTPLYQGGPGGWHTCDLSLAGQSQPTRTIALPRTPPGFTKGQGQVIKFRVCLVYNPEMKSLTGRYIVCSGRY